MKKIIKFIINFRITILIIIVINTFVLGYIASKGTIASSIGNLFFGDENHEYNNYINKIKDFVSDEVFFIVIEDYLPAGRQKIKTLQKVIDQINEIPDIERVDSLLNAQYIFSKNNTLNVKRYSDEMLLNPDNLNTFFNNIKNDPLYNGIIISKNGKHIAVLIELTHDDARPVERGPLLVNNIFNIFVEHGFSKLKLKKIGIMASLSEIMHQTRKNFLVLYPIVFITLFFTLFILFKSFWPVLITMIVSLIAVIWTVGFSVILDEKINIFIAIAPVIILIITTSDVIHLCSAYILELSAGKTKKNAIIDSGTEVGFACIMTSITTFIGFMSISFTPVPAFKQLGFVLGFGVAAALLLAMTFSPILFSIMKSPDFKKFSDFKIQIALERILKKFKQKVFNNTYLILFLFICLLVFSIYGLLHLNIETNFNERLNEKNEIRVYENFFNNNFAKSNFLDIFISSTEKNDIFDPNIFSNIIDFQNELSKNTDIDKIISIVDLFEIIHKQITGENIDNLKKLLSRELLSQYILLFEMSGGTDLNRFINFERNTIRLSVRLSNNDIRATYETGCKIKSFSDLFFNNKIKVETTGLVYLMGMFIDKIINGQKKGVLIAFFMIFILMIIWTKSIKTGFWSMIPNILPVLALGGLVGILYDKVDSDTLPIAMIAIGIGVDDTIHFITRLRFESQKTKNTLTALNTTFHFTGRAILITTFILVSGFLPFSLSDYYSIKIMGTLLPFTLIIALLADLFLVTAFVKLKLICFSSVKSEGIQ